MNIVVNQVLLYREFFDAHGNKRQAIDDMMWQGDKSSSSYEQLMGLVYLAATTIVSIW